jgi:K+-transporting ATPase ATPase C chain
VTAMTTRAAMRQYAAALRALIVLTALCGILYPLAVTGVAQVAFPHHANGSMISHAGSTIGSSLIGQAFVDSQGKPLPQWFQPRPSAAVDPSNKNDPGYNPLFSGGSNLGPSNPELVKLINDRRTAIAAFDGVAPQDVPADAVTASSSGLDPHISPAYAYEQVDRVAKARNLHPYTVRALVTDHIADRTLAILGQPRVNVVELNLALAQLVGQ